MIKLKRDSLTLLKDLGIEVHVPPLKLEVGEFAKPKSKRTGSQKTNSQKKDSQKRNSQKKDSQKTDSQKSESEKLIAASQKLIDQSQKPDYKRPLTREEADLQRFTTVIRWVVEATNANLKVFRFFQTVAKLRWVPSFFQMACLRVVAALLNRRFLINEYKPTDKFADNYRDNLFKVNLQFNLEYS